MSDHLPALIAKTEELVDSITFDESGTNGRGGNGGLISRKTITLTNELRQLIHRVKHEQRKVDDV